MCDITNQFKLCTCSNNNTKIIHNKNSKQQNKNIIWILERCVVIESPLDKMMGLMVGPVNQLNELTDAYVKDELNKRNCFDFEYPPEEGDCLVLEFCLTKKEQSEEEYKFMSFIFKSEEWTIAIYDSFKDKTIEFKKGKLKFEQTLWKKGEKIKIK